MTHHLICIQSDNVEKAILIATFHEPLKAKKPGSRSRNVTLKKLRTKAQRRRPLDRGSALRLCAFAREIFAQI
jgi:hypothetical protein